MVSEVPRLAISFSGGESSAVMSLLCLKHFAETHEIRSVFMNTGCEHEETLRFVNACDEHIFGGSLVWLEAVINGAGVGPTAKVVTYETAARNGEPFAAAVAKHGVFGPSHPQCNSRLKTEPMLWYRKQTGWAPGTYDTAIGIRADEIDRASENAKRDRIVYPLISFGIRKPDVKRIMSKFDWRLKLPGEHYGNCVWCWKKTLRKHLTLAKDNPAIFDFPAAMEGQYGHVNNGQQEQIQARTFFRNRKSAKDIVEMAQQVEFEPWEDRSHLPGLFDDQFDADLDVGGGCGDSCEIGAD